MGYEIALWKRVFTERKLWLKKRRGSADIAFWQQSNAWLVPINYFYGGYAPESEASYFRVKSEFLPKKRLFSVGRLGDNWVWYPTGWWEIFWPPRFLPLRGQYFLVLICSIHIFNRQSWKKLPFHTIILEKRNFFQRNKKIIV